MLKIQRDYQPADFSTLLEELQKKTAKEKIIAFPGKEMPPESDRPENPAAGAQSEKSITENSAADAQPEKKATENFTAGRLPQESLPKQNNIPKPVSIHRRRRQSQLDNVRMRYAFSTAEKVLHDRSCECVWRIPDEEFQMTADFTLEMRLCPYCQRQAVIRAGIGDDGKRIKAYNWFFEHVKASAGDLYELVISHGAALKWIDRDNMQIHVNEDTWVVRNKNGKLKLFHNNYYVADGQQRFFESGFHQQNTGGKTDFHSIARIMCNYTWDRHLEGKRAEKEKEELISSAADGTLTLDNYWKEPRRSLWYIHMVYLDRKNYLADKIFEEAGIHPIYKKEYIIPGQPIKAIHCKIQRKQQQAFCGAMKRLACEIVKSGQVDYAAICKKIKAYFDSAQNHG